MKHDHWDIVECTYCKEHEALTDEGLHSEYVQLESAVEELLQCLDAKAKLDAGFRGMGHNVLTESAARIHSCVRRLKDLTGWRG